MKELIPMNEFGVFADIHDTPRVDSRFVAQFFEKRHDHVLRDVENLIAPKFGEIEESVSGLSQAFIKRNFALSSYKDNRGRSQKAYAMTRDGFTMLVMGYTGQKAILSFLHPLIQTMCGKCMAEIIKSGFVPCAMAI